MKPHRLHMAKGLFYPIELYCSLAGSILILRHIKDTDRRSLTPQMKRMEEDITEDFLDFKGSWDFLDSYGVEVPFCIVETPMSFVARPYINGKAMPLMEDGREPASVKGGKVVWVSHGHPEKTE